MEDDPTESDLPDASLPYEQFMKQLYSSFKLVKSGGDIGLPFNVHARVILKLLKALYSTQSVKAQDTASLKLATYIMSVSGIKAAGRFKLAGKNTRDYMDYLQKAIPIEADQDLQGIEASTDITNSKLFLLSTTQAMWKDDHPIYSEEELRPEEYEGWSIYDKVIFQRVLFDVPGRRKFYAFFQRVLVTASTTLQSSYTKQKEFAKALWTAQQTLSTEEAMEMEDIQALFKASRRESA